MKILIIDPPSGWMYGFPKAISRDAALFDLDEWLVHNGYPQKLINMGMSKYCRFWEQEDEKRKG